MCYNGGMDKPAIDVAYVAELARLELTDEEKAVFQPQLENIVKYVEKISSVDISDVTRCARTRCVRPWTARRLSPTRLRARATSSCCRR